MIDVDVLLIGWAYLATISVAMHAVIVLAALSRQVHKKAYLCSVAAQDGGVRNWIMASVAYDVLKPWHVPAVVLRMYLDERR